MHVRGKYVSVLKHGRTEYEEAPELARSKRTCRDNLFWTPWVKLACSEKRLVKWTITKALAGPAGILKTITVHTHDSEIDLSSSAGW